MMDTPSGRFRRQNKNSPGGHKCLRENLFIGSVVRENAQRFADVEEHRRKMFVCCAESVASGGIPVALAATPAEQPVSTGCTFCGPLVALCQKHLAGGRIKRLLNCAMFYLPKFPLVQDIKIAGIKTSVTLYCKIVSTGAGGCTGGRRHSQQDAQIIFEITDADIMSLLQLLIPNIKNAAQKTAIEFRR